MLTRRASLSLIAGGAVVPLLGTCSSEAPQTSTAAELAPDQKWLAKLADGLPEEFDYFAEIEGRLPDSLSGTLYRLVCGGRADRP